MLDVKKLLTKILLRLNNYTKVVETQTITALNKTWVFRRIGNIVFIDASSDMSGTVPAGFTNIGTLNASLRPSYNVYLKCTNTNADIRLYVYPSGVVTFYHPTATSGATNCGFSGYSFIAGGGYFITSLLLTLVRGWRYVRCEETAGEDSKSIHYHNCVRLDANENKRSLNCVRTERGNKGRRYDFNIEFFHNISNILWVKCLGWVNNSIKIPSQKGNGWSWIQWRLLRGCCSGNKWRYNSKSNRSVIIIGERSVGLCDISNIVTLERGCLAC